MPRKLVHPAHCLPRPEPQDTPKRTCDCGRPAVAGVEVTVGVPGESLTRGKIYLCEGCLQEERRTQAFLREIGISPE